MMIFVKFQCERIKIFVEGGGRRQVQDLVPVSCLQSP